MWLYSIHSNDAELIHFLEEYHVKPEKQSFVEILEEPIKCHHNSYIKNNFITQKVKNLNEFFFHYKNYLFLHNIFLNTAFITYFCKYNYPIPVLYFLSLGQITSESSLIRTAAEKNCYEIVDLFLNQGRTEIDDSLFKECKKLTNITIPSTITLIGDHSFKGCRLLKKVVIPTSVTTIKSWCFILCISLQEIAISSSITLLGDFAFKGCSSLTTATIEASINYLPESLFEGCSKLAEIKIFSSIFFNDKFCFNKCSSLKKLTLPDSTFNWRLCV